MSAEAARPPGTRSGRLQVRGKLLGWAALLAATDLAIKTAAEVILSGDHSADLGPLNFKLLYNTGVAFSLGAHLPTWIIITGTGLIIAGLLWYVLAAAPAMTATSRAGAALLVGGAAGNFIDRLDGRGVVDYLHSGWFPTFNLADVFVVTGAALTVLGSFTRPRTPDDD